MSRVLYLPEMFFVDVRVVFICVFMCDGLYAHVRHTDAYEDPRFEYMRWRQGARRMTSLGT